MSLLMIIHARHTGAAPWTGESGHLHFHGKQNTTLKLPGKHMPALGAK